MKKVLAVLLTLTLVLALAVSSSAASLGSKWSELAPNATDHDGGAIFGGEVAVDGNSIVLKVPEGGWWPEAGVKYADKLSLDGLEITFNAKAFTYESANGYFAVTISDKPLTGFVDVVSNPGIVGGRAYGVGNAGAKTTSVTFYGTERKMWITDGGSIKSYDYQPTNTAQPGKDVTLSFHDTMDGLRLKLNGKDVKVMIENEDEDLEEVDLIIQEGNYPSGKVYLTLSAQGYGGSGSEAITIKKINGTAANSLGGSNGGNNTSPDTADIDVVIIAGAMIVALAAAAFVLKARKA